MRQVKFLSIIIILLNMTYAQNLEGLKNQALNFQNKIDNFSAWQKKEAQEYREKLDNQNKKLSDLKQTKNDLIIKQAEQALELSKAQKAVDDIRAEVNKYTNDHSNPKYQEAFQKWDKVLGPKLVLIQAQFQQTSKTLTMTEKDISDLEKTMEDDQILFQATQKQFKDGISYFGTQLLMVNEKIKEIQIPQVLQTISTNTDANTTALGSSYDMQLANLNSLNKRMGELRENPNSHGIWARAFTGLQTTKFSNQTNIFYTTIQGGYDYAFGFNEANNYLGLALSYMNSVIGSDHFNTLNSNGVELALYNSYVQDGGSKENNFKNGFYNDTIIKLGYIQTAISINKNAQNHTDSFSFVLSDELGYRFLLGGSKQWYIDPQIELAIAYLDQSILKQILAGNPLIGDQDAIFTFRGRVGSNFGYRFDKYTQDKNFRSEIYLGSYFVGDYITGGKINFTHPYTTTFSISPLNSTARWTLNLGTNFTIKDHHRIYFDFERSFFGKIITQYQVSLGYRYSFGQSKYSKTRIEALQTSTK